MRTTHVPEEGARIDIRESGIVPARDRGEDSALAAAVTLRAPRPGLNEFGRSLASCGDLLLIGCRQDDRNPFAVLYRITDQGLVRERLLRGAEGHQGPSLATDGERVAVGQPAADGSTGFACVYRRKGTELELEAMIEGKPDEANGQRVGEKVAIGDGLLVLGQPASVDVYRHAAVGWLAAGSLQPELPYAYNPGYGQSIAVLAGRVLVGNPIEINGHRAGSGRVFVYRPEGDQMVLEAELLGDGIESGRAEPPLPGFGASIQTHGEYAIITAPRELSITGAPQSRVYVFRAVGRELQRVAALDVPSCQGGASMVGDKLLVLGTDALYAFTRVGDSFQALATYAVENASQTTVSSVGRLVALSSPEDGAVEMMFAEQL
ncbi:MAG TPA: hypothetical protein VFX59_09570 [Polyangiales bacterium]|nr:hypothetical protein [Polyangiales bacterium]